MVVNLNSTLAAIIVGVVAGQHPVDASRRDLGRNRRTGPGSGALRRARQYAPTQPQAILHTAVAVSRAFGRLLAGAGPPGRQTVAQGLNNPLSPMEFPAQCGAGKQLSGRDPTMAFI